MSTSDYTTLLPTDQADPKDAVEALVDKLPSLSRQGLFSQNGFAWALSSRIGDIISRLPEDPKERRPLEVELAHIIYEVEVRHNLIISRNPIFARCRAIENTLIREGVFDEYQAFSNGTIDTIDITKQEEILIYLEYLFLNSNISWKHAKSYLTTCIQLSQLEERADTLMAYLAEAFEGIPDPDIADMFDEHDYLGGTEGDEHIASIIREDPTLTYSQATQKMEMVRQDMAAFHLFFGKFWNHNILPSLKTLSTSNQRSIIKLANDFRDIVDPEHFIPMYFDDERGWERLIRQEIFDEGRTLH